MTTRSNAVPAARNTATPAPLLRSRPGEGSPGRSSGAGQPGEQPAAGAGGPVPGSGSGLLVVASCLLFLLAAAQGYVSFRAQYVFVDHAKHAWLPSVLEALGLDTGAVIFALLALSLARRGGRAATERALNLACAAGSLTMNLLAADLGSPRSVTVWVLPSALYALASDRLIAVVRRWVHASGPASILHGDPGWRAAGGVALWMLRLVLDVPGTVTGFRRWVLAAAPLAPGTRLARPPAHNPQPGPGPGTPPGPPGPAAPSGPATTPAQPTADALARPALAPGETKREALIRLYEYCGAAGDPRYGDRAKAAAVAGEIAARIGYHPGTARRELARYLASRNGPVTTPEPSSDRHEVTDR